MVAALTAAALLAPAAQSATADTDTSRSCTRPIGTSQCLENVVCGAPSTIARAVGADEYGIDPTVNCVQ